MKDTVQDTTVGLRVGQRRVALGLSVAEVAKRAGMSPDYLEYVESRQGHPSVGVVRRLAEALHTTVEHLYGHAVMEPGVSFPSHQHVVDIRTHVVTRLTEQECLLLLGSVPVGRVAFVVNGPPLVLPVNFTAMGHEVVMQTSETSALALAARAGRMASFEVDDIDEPSRLGWSVLCQGPLHALDRDEASRHSSDTLAASWFGDDRRTVVTLRPTSISGRRIGLR